MTTRLDHLVIAAPDLDRAKAEFYEATGCKPADGGAHRGLGTRNALASFGGETYLEIIAPDPEQPLEQNFGGVLAKLPTSMPLHWAIRVDDLEAISHRARELGFVPHPIRDMSRTQPDGVRLDWQLMGIGGHSLGGFMPFFIDWLECRHPSRSNPKVGELSVMSVRSPAGPIHSLLSDADGVTLSTGEPEFRFVVSTLQGDLEFVTTELAGFGFDGVRR